jgi:hypothetical protein
MALRQGQVHTMQQEITHKETRSRLDEEIVALMGKFKGAKGKSAD